MQFAKVIDEWHNEDRDELRTYDGLPAWATVAIVFWCIAEILMT